MLHAWCTQNTKLVLWESAPKLANTAAIYYIYFIILYLLLHSTVASIITVLDVSSLQQVHSARERERERERETEHTLVYYTQYNYINMHMSSVVIYTYTRQRTYYYMNNSTILIMELWLYVQTKTERWLFMRSGLSLTQWAWRGVTLTASLLPETDKRPLAASSVMFFAYVRLAL